MAIVGWIMSLYHGMIFLAPAFFANSVAVFVSGLGPVDRGKLFFDGKPILGKNKTIGGVLGAILGGGLTGYVVLYYFPDITGLAHTYYWWLGYLFGFTAILGDAIGSFIKRRVNLNPGGPFPVMDQIGFVLVSFAVVLPIVQFPYEWIWYVTLFTLFGHLASNMFAYKMGWKDVWW